MRCSPSLRRALLVALLASPIVGSSMFVGGSPAMAAVGQPAVAPAAVQQFLANPAALLAQFPNGGPALSTQIRDLAASDPAALNAIVGLLANATPDQASAIGVGLGQAAELAVNSDPAFATQIQTAIVNSNNNSALVAFSAVVGGDIKLAAAGPGGGGGGGGELPTGSNSPTGGIGGRTPQIYTRSPITRRIVSLGHRSRRERREAIV